MQKSQTKPRGSFSGRLGRGATQGLARRATRVQCATFTSTSDLPHRAVVAGCECPRSSPTVGRPKPLPTATLAKLCRKSIAQQIYPIARRGMRGQHASNGTPAVASFLVGTSLSKTVARRQARLPLCFGQMRPTLRHDRFGTMCIAPAVSPFSVKIVRMVSDTARLSASHRRLYLQRTNRISVGSEISPQFNFATALQNSRDQHSKVTGRWYGSR